MFVYLLNKYIFSNLLIYTFFIKYKLKTIKIYILEFIKLEELYFFNPLLKTKNANIVIIIVKTIMYINPLILKAKIKSTPK